MAKNLKCVALLSGGKDSVCAILAALELGHRVVQLAHLSPKDGADETDSYMYQSVGSAAVPLIAQSMELPLTVRQIEGTPVMTNSLDYEVTEGDEVEDLFLLLSEIKNQDPSIEAVISGAIQSSYQKARVEHVCRRLQLVSLVPLWQLPQEVLLKWMTCDVPRLNAIIIKVASLGLNRKHLGKSLQAVAPDLIRLSREFGVHCCGEGGEFETLTLDAPNYRYPLKIVESNVEVVVAQDDKLAPVLFIRPKDATQPLLSIDKTASPRVQTTAFFPPFTGGKPTQY